MRREIDPGRKKAANKARLIALNKAAAFNLMRRGLDLVI
jgi:hypothetical protein